MKKELELWPEFVERWLELAEVPRPVTRLPEEVDPRTALVKAGGAMKRSLIIVDKELLAQSLRSVAEWLCHSRWPNLTEERRYPLSPEDFPI